MNQNQPLSTVAQAFCSVKPTPSASDAPLLEPMIHHNVFPDLPDKIVLRNGAVNPRGYGVSSSWKILTPGLFQKRYDQIRHFLQCGMGSPTAEREVTLRLLKLWAYYGDVFPKQSQICELPGCSKATFFRTIRSLENRGLIRRVRRFILRPHAQISNLYLLHGLLLVIARYLTEHGQMFSKKVLEVILAMPGQIFWRTYLTFQSVIDCRAVGACAPPP